MATLKLTPHLSLKELQKKLDAEKDLRFFKQWQILNAVVKNPGMSAESISLVLSSTLTIVRRTVQLYNNHGADFMNQLQWGGRREVRSNLSLKEEEELLKSIEEKSLKGEILTAKDIRKEVEKKVKKEVSEDYIWDLFKRHGWKKKAPRPKHPKQNIKAQEEFKKNSLRYWQATL